MHVDTWHNTHFLTYNLKHCGLCHYQFMLNYRFFFSLCSTRVMLCCRADYSLSWKLNDIANRKIGERYRICIEAWKNETNKKKRKRTNKLLSWFNTYIVTMYWGICASVSTFPWKVFIVLWYSINLATSDYSLLDLVVELACDFIRNSSESVLREPK